MVSGIVAGRLALVTGAGSGIGRATCQVLSREGATVIAADRNYDAAVETIKTHTALASGSNGTGSGIGRATCQVLSREGATVIAADRNYDAAVETIKTHTALASGSNAIGDHSAIELNVADSKSVRDVLEQSLEQYKSPPTIVVNCAGITRDNWLLKLSEDDYNSVLDVNLKGTFLVMQAFAQAMTERGKPGSIVNISSIVGKYGNIGQTNYASSKAGVIAMTQTAAKELGKFNIRVNVVLPGPTETPIVKTVPDKVLEKMIKMIPLGRIGSPTEIAEVITFLCSDKSSFVTGAAVDVTGGF